MPLTCSRMKPSASPNPASGPVLGLTWPILITRLWACAGITRSTVGTAMAPNPVRMTLRREMGEPSRRFADACSTGMEFLRRVRVRMLVIVQARLFQALEDFSPQLSLLLSAPLAEAFARLEAQLALIDELLEIGRWGGPLLNVRQHRTVNGEREIRADKICVFQGTQHAEAAPEARLDHGVDCLGVAYAALHQGDRFAP